MQTQRSPWLRFGNGGLLLLIASGLVFACFYPKTRESGQGVPKASRAFSHKDHEETLKKYRFRCTDCHLYDLAYLERDEKIRDEISKAITRAGLESCHFCHVKHPERVEAALKCLDCHADIRPIRPMDHRAGWKATHGTRIALSEVACSQCHSNRFCVQCHTRRDQADRNYHKGSIIVSHPIEARMDPARCQKCHQPAYCTRCHQFGRF